MVEKYKFLIIQQRHQPTHMKTLTKYILIGTFLSLTACSSAPQIEDAATATELVENCRKEIANLEEQANAADDVYEKATLCKLASDKGVECHMKGVEKFPESTDLAKLGADDYGETSNFLCYCKNKIADLEIELDEQPDPIKRFDLLENKLAFSIECLQASQSAIHDPSLAPKLSADSLGESSNLKKHCEGIIEDLKELIDEASCEERAKLIEELNRIDISCQKKWSSVIFDPSMAPRLWDDPYDTAKYSEGDSCANWAEYGFPVCNEEELPEDCQPHDDRPGWDCYTFEEEACSPTTRCFCIAPAEAMTIY